MKKPNSIPLEVVKAGRWVQQSNCITYAQELIDGLDIRNELSHDYSGEKFERLEQKLREETFVALEKLHLFFVNEKANG